jgi:hypothetical protein
VFDEYKNMDTKGKLVYFDRKLNPNHANDEADERAAAFGWDPEPEPAGIAGETIALLVIIGLWAILSPDPFGDIAFAGALCAAGT